MLWRSGKFRHFVPNFWDIWWFSKVERDCEGAAKLWGRCETLKNHQLCQKFGKKLRKALFKMWQQCLFRLLAGPRSVLIYHSGPGNFKKYRPKKDVKSNESISRKNIFDKKIRFLQFQKWPKINVWTGKKFKTARNTISRKIKKWFVWFREFLCLDFF